MSSLPPIPDIGGDVDLVLDVYTHASVRRPSITQMNEEYGDTDRLAELGANALDLVVTNHFYRVRPFLSGREIQVRARVSPSSSFFLFWPNMPSFTTCICMGVNVCFGYFRIEGMRLYLIPTLKYGSGCIA